MGQNATTTRLIDPAIYDTESPDARRFRAACKVVALLPAMACIGLMCVAVPALFSGLFVDALVLGLAAALAAAGAYMLCRFGWGAPDRRDPVEVRLDHGAPAALANGPSRSPTP